MRLATLALMAVLLAGCNAQFGGPALLSAQSPAGTGLVNANNPPQSPNSLPPGAEGLHPPNSPFAFAPNYGSITLHP